MNDAEKLIALRAILKDQIKWVRKHKIYDKNNDEKIVYNNIREKFDDVERHDLIKIIEILIEQDHAPCPWCGCLLNSSESEDMMDVNIHSEDMMDVKIHFVQCDCCGACGPYTTCKDSARQRWDKRCKD